MRASSGVFRSPARAADPAPSSHGRGVIDCDVHCAPASVAQLAPYLSEYWQDYIANSGIKIMGLPVAYPPGAPTQPHGRRRTAGAEAPSTYDEPLKAGCSIRTTPGTPS